MDFRQEYSIGHELDQGSTLGLIVETHFVSDDLAQRGL